MYEHRKRNFRRDERGYADPAIYAGLALTFGALVIGVYRTSMWFQRLLDDYTNELD